MDYTWKKTTADVYHAIYNQHKEELSVFEGYTEMDSHGDKLKAQVIAWGFKKAEHPIIRSELKGFDNWTYYILFTALEE